MLGKSHFIVIHFDYTNVIVRMRLADFRTLNSEATQ